MGWYFQDKLYWDLNVLPDIFLVFFEFEVNYPSKCHFLTFTSIPQKSLDSSVISPLTSDKLADLPQQKAKRADM